MSNNNKTNKITSATDRNLLRNDENILQQIDREKQSTSQIYKLNLSTEKENPGSKQSLQEVAWKIGCWNYSKICFYNFENIVIVIQSNKEGSMTQGLFNFRTKF